MNNRSEIKKQAINLVYQNKITTHLMENVYLRQINKTYENESRTINRISNHWTMRYHSIMNVANVIEIVMK